MTYLGLQLGVFYRQNVFPCPNLVLHDIRQLIASLVTQGVSQCLYQTVQAMMLINLDKYVWLSIVIKFSSSPKVSHDLNKEITQTRKTDSKLLSPML